MSALDIDAAAGNRLRATLIGGIAPLLWATLALLTTLARPVPAFQLVALTFAVAFAAALVKWSIEGRAAFARLRQPGPVWLLGIGGLFLYHVFYFTALARAPAVDASLIAYLWPLLLVLFSSLLPGETLRWWHAAGAAAGLAGAVLLITGGGTVTFRAEYAAGYGAAFACALTWSGYSVLSRRLGAVPTDVVGGFCGATAVLGLMFHLRFEETQWPADPLGWAAIVGLGLGPVGAAFFAWDHGVKRGDIKALGALSYASPLLSTLLLIGFGRAEASWLIAAACLLIVGGALVAGRDLWRR